MATTRQGPVLASSVPILKPNKPWCVKDRHGVWHACEENRKPVDGVVSVEVACGGFLILPHDIDMVDETCPDCRQVLTIRLDTRKARG